MAYDDYVRTNGNENAVRTEERRGEERRGGEREGRGRGEGEGGLLTFFCS